jgi:hypothetical protein
MVVVPMKKIRVFHLDLSSDVDIPATDENIIVCDRLSSVKVLSLCLEKSVNHIVQTSNTSSEAEIKLSSTMILSPEEFMNYPLSLILGIEKPTAETEKQASGVSFQIGEIDDKSKALNKIDEFVVKHSNRGSLATDIRLVADELITNSIFNAPYVNLENSNSPMPRDSNQIKIDPARKPLVFAGATDDRIVLGCTDYYGRLNIKKLIERIQQCYVNGPRQMMNFGPGGAGIGSFMIFDSCISFYLAVNPGKSTTVGCAFPIKMSTQERYSVPKNLHVIFNESDLSAEI